MRINNETLKIVSLFLCISVFIAAQGNGIAGDTTKLVSKLQHNDPQVRLSAVEELGKIGDDKSVRALMDVIEDRGEEWKIQVKAIKLLSEIKSPKAIDLLIKILDDPFFTNDCPALKWNAALALGNFKNSSRVVEALINALNDRTLYIREAAIQSLGEIGDKRAVPYLISALKDKSFAIKISAINALQKIGDPEAKPFLKRILESDTDEHIKEEAEKALKFLSGETVNQS